MATGHPLAGFGNYLNRVQRASSAHPIGSKDIESKYAQLDRLELDDIKKQAYQEWARRDKCKTTYDHFHGEKSFYEAAENRPTSPTRRNKPHPPLIFLTNRLHHIDGFFNPDATMGKDTYKVDDSVPLMERVQRDDCRRKFDGRPRTAAVLQQTSGLGELKQRMGPWEAQATEAWMRAANDADRKDMQEDLDMGAEQPIGIPSPVPVASCHRFMKPAGAQEASRVMNIVGRKDYTFDPGQRRSLKATYVTPVTRFQPPTSRTKPVYQYRPKRGDFLIHPDYPPTLEGHGLPDWPVKQPERPRYIYHRRKLIAV